MSPGTQILILVAAVSASAIMARRIGYRAALRDLEIDHRIALLHGRVIGLEQIAQRKDAAA